MLSDCHLAERRDYCYYGWRRVSQKQKSPLADSLACAKVFKHISFSCSNTLIGVTITMAMTFPICIYSRFVVVYFSDPTKKWNRHNVSVWGNDWLRISTTQDHKHTRKKICIKLMLDSLDKEFRLCPLPSNVHTNLSFIIGFFLKSWPTQFRISCDCCSNRQQKSTH